MARRTTGNHASNAVPLGFKVAQHCAMQRLNDLSLAIIQSAIEIHRTIGPGLLESTYRRCMIHKLHQRGLLVMSEQVVPIANKPLGLLINVNVALLRNGVRRIKNGF